MRALSRWLLTVALCCYVLPGCSKQNQEPAAARQEVDLSKDPLYGSYPFDEQGSIDLGVQPLCMPESSVSELLVRDRTLAARLQAKNLVLKPFPFYKGKDVYHFMSKGKLEAGILGDLPAVIAASTGEIVIVAMIKQGFSSIVAGKPMLVQDLKGKRVATVLGSTAHFMLLTALESEGLTERDVKLVDMEVNAMAQALAEGKVAAFSAWEPTPAAAFDRHPGFYLVHKGLSYGFLAFRRDFIAAHPAQARDIVAAVVRSCLWMRRPGEMDRVAGWTQASAAGFHENPYPLKADKLIALTRQDLLNIPIAPQLPERLLRKHELLWKEFSFLQKAGKISQKVSWDEVRNSFDTDMLRTVLSDTKGYALERFDYGSGNQAEGAR